MGLTLLQVQSILDYLGESLARNVIFWFSFILSLFGNVLFLQGGSTSLYQYDHLGRISRIVLPTGESISLSSRLTADDELEVHISSPVQGSVNMDSSVHTTTIKMEGHSYKKMIIREGLCCITVFFT